jgi:hypothetical protein
MKVRKLGKEKKMKRQIRILMLALAAFALTSTVVAQPVNNSLEGVWSFTVTPDPATGLAAYSNLRSFSRDGVAILVDGATHGLGIASTGVGVWERTGGHEFRLVMYAVLTVNGVQIGRQKLGAVLTLDPSGNTLSGIGTTTVFDMTGAVKFNGTAKITGERLPLIED